MMSVKLSHEDRSVCQVKRRGQVIRLAGVACLVMLISCDIEPKCDCKRVIEVEPFHATRAFVTRECTDGRIIREGAHWSWKYVCIENSIYVGDYIPGYGTRQYGKVP
jgi:hypothetical protein